MSGYVTLALLALLTAFCVRWVSRRLRLPVPAQATVMVVFVLVVLALYGQHLK